MGLGARSCFYSLRNLPHGYVCLVLGFDGFERSSLTKTSALRVYIGGEENR
jgi:hypothetical protein